ncbi:hypothetical protein ABZZ20_26175 [Streptomyces sp. NPDC006430]|uniref:hypothetical protein n=1 Tax=Streptomyces sp. NPDC006430 TaxID=3154299 RepID=UPI0033BB8D72
MAAEIWGMWPALAPTLDRCTAVAGDGDGDDAGDGDGDGDALDLIERPGTVPVPGPELSADPRFADLLLVPWIACTRCGRSLARAHRLEPWEELSHLAEHYVLLAPDRSAPPVLFDFDAAWDALTALRRCCARP